MMAAVPEKKFSASGINIRAAGGSGIATMLVHGMAANTHWWDGVMPHFAGNLRPAAIDFRGHGDSVWQDAYTRDNWIDDIETARRALNWDKFYLCGHSMGARIALQYAARHPQRVTAVAAIDFLPELKSDRGSRFSRARGRPQPVYPDENAALGRFHLEPKGTTLTKENLLALGKLCIKPVPGGFTWKFDWRALSVDLEPIWDQLPGIKAPVLIVRGEKSIIMSSEEMNRVARALANGRVAEIPRAYHHIPLDEPAAMAQTLLDFAAQIH